MYTCDSCGNRVLAKAGDPIHFVSHRKVCTGCLHIEAHAPASAPAARTNRADAGRARWAALPEEKRAARLAALAKGRAARVEARVAAGAQS